MDQIKKIWREYMHQCELRGGQYNDYLMALCYTFNPFVSPLTNPFQNWKVELWYFCGITGTINDTIIDTNHPKFGKGVRILQKFYPTLTYEDGRLILNRETSKYLTGNYDLKFNLSDKDANVFHFWAQQHMSDDLSHLSKVVYWLFHIIVTNAGVEGSFKREKYVLSFDRVRLTEENINHELMIKCNYHFLNEFVGTSKVKNISFKNVMKRIEDSGKYPNWNVNVRTVTDTRIIIQKHKDLIPVDELFKKPINTYEMSLVDDIAQVPKQKSSEIEPIKQSHEEIRKRNRDDLESLRETDQITTRKKFHDEKKKKTSKYCKECGNIADSLYPCEEYGDSSICKSCMEKEPE